MSVGTVVVFGGPGVAIAPLRSLPIAKSRPETISPRLWMIYFNP
jgi:hypothetical protein